MGPERLFAGLVLALWIWFTVYAWRQEHFTGWLDKVIGAMCLGALYAAGAIIVFGFLAALVAVTFGVRP